MQTDAFKRIWHWMRMTGAVLALGGCSERGWQNGLAAQDTGHVVLPNVGETCEDRAFRDKRDCAGACELKHGASCMAGCNKAYAAAIRVCNGEIVDAGTWQQSVPTSSQKAAAKSAAQIDSKPGGWPLAGY